MKIESAQFYLAMTSDLKFPLRSIAAESEYSQLHVYKVEICWENQLNLWASWVMKFSVVLLLLFVVSIGAAPFQEEDAEGNNSIFNLFISSSSDFRLFFCV